jgi:hypothetical protein
MTGTRAASATFTRGGYRRLSQLLRRRIEGSLHRNARFRCLHPGKKAIEFAAQSVELDLRNARESVEFVHGNQNCLGSAVFGDDHYAPLNDGLKNAAKLVLHGRRRNRSGFDAFAAAIPVTVRDAQSPS